ncbi:MAG: zinc ABC transporter substrate-binding protein [Candidatus Bathyarchaeota archaeon]|nr:zinc ABC transporter substrate-binding protein [Candidatus Bathyarchaeum tardum]WGM89392.1 MAG: zinc ABC transporter substrate-binding protein [Candidatus Bathyarchaeum tardum]
MKNKKIFTFSMTLLMLPLLLVSVTHAQTAEKPIIVCTTTAVGSVVEDFLDDNAEVLVLVQPGLCPADFDLKPGYVDAVSKATILFKQNIQGEFWLDNLLESAGNDDLTVVAIPGVYNTPEGAKSYIRDVGGNLSQILGINLDSETSEMITEIDQVSTWITTQAESLEASNLNVICMGWLKTFIESAGFNVVSTFNPPETLSAGDITALLETAHTDDVALIVDNLQIDTDFGGGIASQVGAEHLVLTNFPGAIPGTETLAKMLRYNAEQLFRGASTWHIASALKAEKINLGNQVTLYQITTVIAVVIAATEAVMLYSRKKK